MPHPLFILCLVMFSGYVDGYSQADSYTASIIQQEGKGHELGSFLAEWDRAKMARSDLHWVCFVIVG